MQVLQIEGTYSASAFSLLLTASQDIGLKFRTHLSTHFTGILSGQLPTQATKPRPLSGPDLTCMKAPKLLIHAITTKNVSGLIETYLIYDL
jgi:hypothetical protein